MSGSENAIPPIAQRDIGQKAKRRSESLDGLKGESGNESTVGGRDQERGSTTSKNVYYIKYYYNKICIL